MTIKIPLMAVALTCAGAFGAAAQDILVLGGGKAELTFPSDGAHQDLSLYAEIERAGFYGGALGLIGMDQAANKVKFYAGYRAETAKGFTYDLSYTRFIYPNDGGDCCGEIALSFGQPIGKNLTLSTEITYDPDVSLGTLELGAEYDLSEKMALSVNLGMSQHSVGPTEKTWDLGVGYDLSDATSIDLRYYDGPDLKGYMGVAVSFETNLLGG